MYLLQKNELLLRGKYNVCNGFGIFQNVSTPSENMNRYHNPPVFLHLIFHCVFFSLLLLCSVIDAVYL